MVMAVPLRAGRPLPPPSKYFPWNMAVLRLNAVASFAAFAYLTFTAPRYLRAFVVKNRLPESVANHRVIFVGQGIAAVLGPIGLLWNLWTFMYVRDRKSARWFLLWSMVEFMIGVVLLVAGGLQGRYLPHTLKDCASIEDWTLFVWAGQLWSQSPTSNCRGWVNIWIICIVGGILSILGAGLGVWLMISTRDAGFGPNYRRPRVPYKDWKLDLLVRFIETWIPQTVIILPRVVKRYFQKRSTNYPGINSTSFPAKPSKHDLISHVGSAKRQYRADLIADLLSAYPIRVSLLEENNLCYTDILNFALTSRATWTAMFPAPDSDTWIRQHSCRHYVISGPQDDNLCCWSCNSQICHSCTKHKFLPDTPAEKHIMLCDAYCTHCYLYYMSTANWRFDVPWHCECTLPKPPRYQISRWGPHEPNGLYSRATGWSINVPLYEEPQDLIYPRDVSYRRQLCANCARLPPVEVLRKREEWGKQLILRKNGASRCKGCERELKRGGVRWWGCETCRRECRCELHEDFDKSISGSVDPQT